MSSMEINAIYEGDNLEILDKFPDESVDMIYADPPFFSNKDYEIIWEDGAEIRAFQDRWKGGINHYISWMEPRLRECHRVLKDTGNLYLHCDWHANAHLRILLDKIFGKNKFRNEIVWYYTGWNRKLKNSFSKGHDTILFYGKSNKQKFNSYAEPWESEEQYVNVRKQKVRTDEDGKKYVLSDAGGGDRVKRYLKEAMEAGRPVDDVWEIDKLTSSSNERMGYPTQKPVKLLKRIVEASSDKGDIVLDPFCGCGTTLAAAEELDREWIGIDVSPTACKLMKERLRKRYSVDAQLIKGEVDMEYVKDLDPFEFQNWVVTSKFLGVPNKKKTKDMGVDGRTPPVTGGYPIQVKQSENVGRTVVDKFQTAMKREGKDKGYIVAFSFTSDAREEVARVKNEEDITIHLRTVEELLEGTVEVEED